MRDLYNFQIGSRAAIYPLYRYSTPVGALDVYPEAEPVTLFQKVTSDECG